MTRLTSRQMPEPVTEPDNRQPGGSEPVEDLYREVMPGGSGAGSTVEQFEAARRKWFVETSHDSDQTPEVHGSFNAGYAAGSAALEAAQKERDNFERRLGEEKAFSQRILVHAGERAAKSRATEAELRAKVGIGSELTEAYQLDVPTLIAALEAVQREIERVTRNFDAQVAATEECYAEIYEAKRDIAQSRAKEAELRAALRGYVTGCHACLGHGSTLVFSDCPECRPARRALDAAEQPARELPPRGPGYDPLCQCGQGELHRLRLHDSVAEQPARAERPLQRDQEVS